MSIKIAGVGKRFGDFVALADIDLDIPTGELTALLGPSGGGKSTLLRIIAGLELSDTGTVEIEGNDATRLPAQKRNVGFVFQHYAAFRHMSVAAQRRLRAEDPEAAQAGDRRQGRRAARLVHLSQFADRLPSQLSGGQRQRMALARALAIEPTVLLLDEPFGALDAKVRKELRAWLRRLHDEVHVTTVFVTHDQEEALEVADQIVVINNGRDRAGRQPRRAVRRPASEFVMSFLGPVTTLRRAARPAARHRGRDRPVPRRLRGSDRRSQPGRLRGAAGDRAGRRAATHPGPCHPDPRREAAAKRLAAGDRVWLRPVPGASTVPASSAGIPSAVPGAADPWEG